jgi:pyruvate/2-oxoglutarate dehydrogenase complex dihydrolipoamide dehydrogenase (E3) component
VEHLTTDIAVIGTGGAGMAATITAAEAGAKVIILEKRPFPGGTSTTPMCVSEPPRLQWRLICLSPAPSARTSSR